MSDIAKDIGILAAHKTRSPIVHWAYLVAICDEKTRDIIRSDIWSSPEWEQSQRLPGVRTYVAWSVCGSSFQEARDYIVEMIGDERSRCHYLLEHLRDRDLGGSEECQG